MDVQSVRIKPGRVDEYTVDLAGLEDERVTLFTVTGAVLLKLYAVCTTLVDSAGTSTASVGCAYASNDTAFIASTNFEAIDANEIWHDATPDNSIEASTVSAEKLVVDDTIVLRVSGDAINTGVVKFIAVWTPISENGNLVAPTTDTLTAFETATVAFGGKIIVTT